MDYYNFDSESEKFPIYFTLNLSDKLLDKLKQHFDTTNIKFNDSLVFNNQTKQNEHHEEIRMSQRYTIKDPKSFELIKTDVMPLLIPYCKDQNTSMKLVEDELEIIKYNEG